MQYNSCCYAIRLATNVKSTAGTATITAASKYDNTFGINIELRGLSSNYGLGTQQMLRSNILPYQSPCDAAFQHHPHLRLIEMEKSMKNWKTLLLGIAMIANTSFAAPQVVDKVAAVVNGVVLESDVDGLMQSVKLNAGQAGQQLRMTPPAIKSSKD